MKFHLIVANEFKIDNKHHNQTKPNSVNSWLECEFRIFLLHRYDQKTPNNKIKIIEKKNCKAEKLTWTQRKKPSESSARTITRKITWKMSNLVLRLHSNIIDSKRKRHNFEWPSANITPSIYCAYKWTILLEIANWISQFSHKNLFEAPTRKWQMFAYESARPNVAKILLKQNVIRAKLKQAER